MSTFSMSQGVASLLGHGLRLAHESAAESAVVVSVRGDIDAANADELTAYATSAIAPDRGLILDLRDVEFIGTAGVSALEQLNQTGAGTLRMVVVPSRVVTRLLELCPPANSIQIVADLDAAHEVMHQGRAAFELAT